MRQKKLIWHIFPATLMVTIGALAITLLSSSSALEQFYTDWTKSALEDRAFLIEEQVIHLLQSGEKEDLNSFCRRVGRRSSTRITVIAPNGSVIADSDEDPEKMSNHSGRPEISHAAKGQTGSALRFSTTLGLTMLYVAVPIQPFLPSATEPSSYSLRMAVPASFIDKTLHTIRLKVGGIGLGVAFLAMIAAIIVSRRITKPLEEMTAGAEQFARENFSAHLPTAENMSREVAALSSAMNSMAVKLQERINNITKQHNELKSVLTAMVEGVFVVDSEKQVAAINTAAANLLRTSETKAVGLGIQEIIRNIQLGKMVDRVLDGSDRVEESIVLTENGQEAYLQCRGVRLYDGNNECFGAVITMNDVTQIKLLENMRRDFVANVSHELMTPLTSIKGYAETLLDNDLTDPEQAAQFLRIIIRQADRLTALVHDLLKLSRIEKEEEAGELDFILSPLKRILMEAIQVCLVQAQAKEMDIQLSCPDNIEASVDPALIEQAVVNLLVNAIKYSTKGSKVLVQAELHNPSTEAGNVSILVRDFGVGIEKHHLPKLFERFYRSDKARSRKLGGTGLGLAIVKHIVQAHKGSVTVQSEPGIGTTFKIILPMAQFS